MLSTKVTVPAVGERRWLDNAASASEYSYGSAGSPGLQATASLPLAELHPTNSSPAKSNARGDTDSPIRERENTERVRPVPENDIRHRTTARHRNGNAREHGSGQEFVSDKKVERAARSPIEITAVSEIEVAEIRDAAHGRAGRN